VENPDQGTTVSLLDPKHAPNEGSARYSAPRPSSPLNQWLDSPAPSNDSSTSYGESPQSQVPSLEPRETGTP